MNNTSVKYDPKEFLLDKFNTYRNVFYSISLAFEDILVNDDWRTGFKVDGLRDKKYNTFKEYLEKELHTTIDIVKAICSTNTNCLMLLDKAMKVNKKSKNKIVPTQKIHMKNVGLVKNVKSANVLLCGNRKNFDINKPKIAAKYVLARLKNNFPELYDQVLDNKISIFKASILAGYRKPLKKKVKL